MTTIESPRADERNSSRADYPPVEFELEVIGANGDGRSHVPEPQPLDLLHDWRQWVTHLSHRREGQRWPKALDGRRSPLWWSLAPGRRSRETAALLAQLDRVVMRGKRPRGDVVALLRQWVDERPAVALDGNTALEALAWCHALPRLAAVTPSELWWAALRQLAGATRAAEATCPAESPLVHQLLAGELPLALAYRFPEIKSLRAGAATARPTIDEALTHLLDEAAMLHASQLDELVPLVGCWTRALTFERVLARQTASGEEMQPAEETEPNDSWRAYTRIVRNLLRLVRRDGSWMFAPAEASTWRRDLLSVALRLADDDRDRAAARLALPRRAGVSGPPRKKLRDASLHAEEAGVALLRTSWSRTSELVGLTFGDDALQMEFTRGGDCFWQGNWDCRVRLDDRELRLAGPWQSVCWLATKEAVYFELQADYEQDVSVERQIVLGRRDRFLYLADVVLGPTGRRVSYESRLPLADDLDVRAADDTRELHLVGCEADMLVMPLALPEWRSQSCGGSFERDGTGLKLSQTGANGRVYAPVFIDLDPRRGQQACTWRQLTVAEYRQTLAPDVAAGFRVQVGKSQWMFYRSLAPVANRTLLGQNLVSEFLAARFTRKGTTDSIVEIE